MSDTRNVISWDGYCKIYWGNLNLNFKEWIEINSKKIPCASSFDRGTKIRGEMFYRFINWSLHFRTLAVMPSPSLMMFDNIKNLPWYSSTTWQAMVLTMTMTLDQDHGQRNDATVWKYETQWPSMTVVYAKQLPAVDIGAGPISEEGNPGKANGHSSLHTQSQHNSSSLNFKLLPSLPVNTANFQVSLQKKSKLQSSQKQENNEIETW